MSTCGPPGPHGGLIPPKLSVGVATLQGIRNPGSSWNALRMNSLLPMIKKPMRRGAGRQGENGGEYEVQGQPGLQKPCNGAKILRAARRVLSKLIMLDLGA